MKSRISLNVSGRRLALLSAGLAMGIAGPARAVEISLPVEAARLTESPLPGYTLAVALCATCHSAEYMLYQPPASSRSYWQATTVKMQKTFGAPVPDEAIGPIVDYLVKTYGAERERPATPASAATAPAAR